MGVKYIQEGRFVSENDNPFDALEHDEPPENVGNDRVNDPDEADVEDEEPSSEEDDGAWLKCMYAMGAERKHRYRSIRGRNFLTIGIK